MPYLPQGVLVLVRENLTRVRDVPYAISISCGKLDRFAHGQQQSNRDSVFASLKLRLLRKEEGNVRSAIEREERRANVTFSFAQKSQFRRSEDGVSVALLLAMANLSKFPN